MAFPSNCNPRLVNVSASNGCTLTRANILAMTPQDFEDQGFKEVKMDQIITNAQEARMAGYIENTLEMLLMSRVTPIKSSLTKTRIGASESVIAPFILRRQQSPIHANYFQVNSGTATPGAGSGGLHAGAWNLTVKNSGSTYGTVLAALERYFLPGKYILVEAFNATTNAAYSLQYKIIASVNAGSSPALATLTLEPNITSAAWADLTADEKAVYQPTAGLVIPLANSVSDFESWGENEVAENPNKLLAFWLQRSRYTHEYNDQYMAALNAALTSGYFKEFLQLPLAKQKALQHKKFVTSLINSFFYGQQINGNQTVETYRDLPTVVDPANPDCVLEYKANALGVMTQLDDCSRSLDHQGNTLNLDSLLDAGYALKRRREVTGGSVNTIDFMTDRFTAGRIYDAFVSFYKSKGIDTNRNIGQNEKLKFDNQQELTYNVFQLPPEKGGYNLAIFHHPFFDDKLSASPTSTGGQNRSRALWGIDWTDVQWGIADNSSATRRTNEADNLYNYVIKPNVKHVELQSTLWAAIVEDPNRHYVVKNFSDACPTLTATGCTV